ncbi:MAG: HDOD domain-containing protein [bacterium]
MEDLSALVLKVKRISSLPTIFLKVNELIDDPMSCASDLGKVIEKDQALTSRLLRLANSAFYGFPGRIETVARAVSLIGFKQLKELVLAMSVRSIFSGFDKSSPINMQSFWQHSIACAIASRNLAILNGVKMPESYFVAGFLHDFGRLILLEQFPQQFAEVVEVAANKVRLVYEVEQEVFGFTHSDVGAELIRSWQLPAGLTEAVACHHTPAQSKDSSHLTAIVHVANVVVHACQLGFSGDRLVPPLDEQAWQLSGLKISMLEPAVNKTNEQLEELSEFLVPG